jgi:hypothetical protein
MASMSFHAISLIRSLPSPAPRAHDCSCESWCRRTFLPRRCRRASRGPSSSSGLLVEASPLPSRSSPALWPSTKKKKCEFKSSRPSRHYCRPELAFLKSHAGRQEIE